MTTSDLWLTSGEMTLLLRLATTSGGRAVPVSSTGRLGGADPDTCATTLAAAGLTTSRREQGQVLTQISMAGWEWISDAMAAGSYRARWGNESHMRGRVPLGNADALSRPLWNHARFILQ